MSRGTATFCLPEFGSRHFKNQSIPFKSTGNNWIGQKDGVVYEYAKNSNMGQIFPIMDFTLNVGDEFIIYEKDYDDEGDSVAIWETDRYKVVAVSDTILASSMDKRLRRCVYVNSFGKNILDCWVEGIGSLTYGILGDRIYWVGSSKRLLQCKQGDEVLYSVDIVTSIQTPQINEVSSNIRFDLQGRPVKSTPKHGIYIKDGRKVKPIRNL